MLFVCVIFYLLARESTRKVEELVEDNKKLTRKVAQNNFVVRAPNCVNLDEIIELTKVCNFEKKTDADVKRDYFRDSSGKSKEFPRSSSYSGTRIDGERKMTEFRRKNLPDADVSFPVFRFQLTEDDLVALKTKSTQICFGDDITKFESFLRTTSDKLRLLRDAFYHIDSTEFRRFFYEHDFQPIFACFLRDMIDNLQEGDWKSRNAQVCPVNDVMLIKTLSDNVKYRGHTDIATFPTNSQHDVRNFENIFEVKVPFSSLRCNKGGYAEKDQLLIQLAGVAAMKTSQRQIQGGALTDSFSLHIAFRVPSDRRSPAKYYISNRVIDPEEFVLYLLLLFCDEDYVISLLKSSSQSYIEPTDEEKSDDDVEKDEEKSVQKKINFSGEGRKRAGGREAGSMGGRTSGRGGAAKGSSNVSGGGKTSGGRKRVMEKGRDDCRSKIACDRNVDTCLITEETIDLSDPGSQQLCEDQENMCEEHEKWRDMKIWRSRFLGIPYLDEASLRLNDRECNEGKYVWAFS